MHAESVGETLSFIRVNPCSSVAFPIAEFRRALIRWYRKSGRDLPWRRTRDPYAILVSEFMLQQTQVAAVVPFYNDWLRRFPDFVSLARASENDVLRAWQGLGYYARARNLHATARTVEERHGGSFPQSVEQMQRLPGIGKYTAHAVASFAFKQSMPIVEANTARVLTRLFDFRKPIDSAPATKTLWQNAAMLVPKTNALLYNSALIDLGALICVSRQPKCGVCPVKEFCNAKDPQTLPARKSRAHMKRLTEKHAFVVRPGKILLEQSAARWRGMWILPPLQTVPANQQPIYESVFPFTNHRVALNVFARHRQKICGRLQRWIRISSLESIPIPSPHRRALRSLLKRDRSDYMRLER
jgi:A/G-specific adenine glycosylase